MSPMLKPFSRNSRQPFASDVDPLLAAAVVITAAAAALLPVLVRLGLHQGVAIRIAPLVLLSLVFVLIKLSRKNLDNAITFRSFAKLTAFLFVISVVLPIFSLYLGSGFFLSVWIIVAGINGFKLSFDGHEISGTIVGVALAGFGVVVNLFLFDSAIGVLSEFV